MLGDRAIGAMFASRASRVAPRRFRLPVLASDLDTSTPSVTVPRTASTALPGAYSLLTRTSMFRVGRLVDSDRTTVTRLITDPPGTSLVGTRASWSGIVHRHPNEVATDARLIQLSHRGEVAPAWMLPPPSRSDTWSIHLPGLGASHLSALRSAELVGTAGIGSIVIDGPATHHTFGIRERALIEAAVSEALKAGAKKIIGVGWSYGTNAILQHIANGGGLDAAVFVSPHLQWRPRIEAAARAAHVPANVLELGMRGIEEQLSKRLHHPVLLEDLGWPTKRPLPIPVLMLHSDGDETLDFRETVVFAAEQPGVELVRLPTAPHTLEWNAGGDATRDAVARFLRRV